MYLKKEIGPIEVSLPDGRKLNRSDLPAKTTKRWVAKLKFKVVEAVQHGLISEDEAKQMYQISEEELDSWVSLSSSNGAAALRATALQKYRQL